MTGIDRANGRAPERGGARSLLWAAVIAGVALIVLLSLGGWQWQRRAQKADFLSALAREATTPPRPLANFDLAQLALTPPGAPAGAGSLAELSRVSVSGTFLSDKAVPVRATLPAARNSRDVGGLGFWWMEPLRLDTGAIVFVNRGFVPSGAGDRPMLVTALEGRQTVVGLIRRAEQRTWFLPPDLPDRRQFFLRDPAVLSSAADVTGVLPFTIDMERTDDGSRWPVGVNAEELIQRIPNNHLSYALTWWGLALTLVGVFSAFAFSRLRRSSAG